MFHVENSFSEQKLIYLLRNLMEEIRDVFSRRKSSKPSRNNGPCGCKKHVSILLPLNNVIRMFRGAQVIAYFEVNRFLLYDFLSMRAFMNVQK